MKGHKKKMVTLLLFVFTLMTACSTATEDSHLNSEINSEDSYKALLFVNNTEYQSIGKRAEDLGLAPGKLIGIVKEKIYIALRPTEELTSNYLSEGTEIYSVEGDPTMVLSKKENGEFEVFE